MLVAISTRTNARVAAAFAAAALVAPFVLLLATPAARANSPIDGIYRVSEGAVSGQGGSAGACWPTPMRSALDPTTPASEASIYDVQIVMAAKDQATFTKPGGGATLLTEPLTTVPVTVPNQLPNYTVTVRQQPVKPSDVWMVDGNFYPTGPGAASVDITWTYQNSPDNSGQCQTEMSGQMRAPVSGGGGIPIDIALATVGGVVIVTSITIGGWRWRNRRKKPLTPPGDRLADKVPAKCRDIATQHDNELEILNSLNDTARELGEKLEKAETIHRNNIIKARMVINLQIIQTVGGFVTDFALALRPGALRAAGTSWMGEGDSWRPPGSISSELSERISQANELWRDLLGKFHQLGNEIEMMKGTVQEAVENLPAVKEAKQVWEIQMNRLGEMMQDLSVAEGLRTQIRELDSKMETARAATDATEAAWREAQGELSKANSAILQARNQMPDEFHNAENALAKAQKQALDMQMSGVEDTLKLSSVTEKAEARMAAAEQASGKQLAKIADLQKAAEEKMALVDKALETHEAAGKVYDKLSDQREVLDNTLNSQYKDLSAADIEKQGKVAAQCERQVQQTEAQGQAQLGRQLAEKEAERERIANEAYAAHELLNDLRAQAERSDTWNKKVSRGAGKVVGVLLTPITYPAGLLMEGWEYVFGSGQSPQEIVDILVRGQTNIRILRSYLSELDNKIFTQEQLVQRLRVQVNACVAGTTVPATPPGPPTSTSPPAKPTPPPTPKPPQQPVITQ